MFLTSCSLLLKIVGGELQNLFDIHGAAHRSCEELNHIEIEYRF